MFNGYKKDIAAAAPKIEELQEGYPTEGSPSLGIPATQPGAAWFHMITTELLNAIKELGVLPDKNSLNQLATAILTLKFPTGTAFEYLRDKNYSKNDIVFTDERLYLCMANNGPASSVVMPGTNDSVWQKIPIKQDVLALVPDATTSVKGIVQLCDNIEQNASNTSMAVTPHAVAQQNFIKSINGTKPDTSGNVSIMRVDSAASADTAKSATNANKATHASTADSATKASQNASGHSLDNTIVKAISISGRTITVTKLDNSTYTLTTQDTNTTYSKVSQFTNDSGYIVDSHNFASGVTVNGYKISVG